MHADARMIEPVLVPRDPYHDTRGPQVPRPLRIPAGVLPTHVNELGVAPSPWSDALRHSYNRTQST